jgi:hypothetical protein
MVDDVILRWVERDYISGAVPSRSIPDDRGPVLYQPPGSDFAEATGRRGGPRDRNMTPGGWDGAHRIRTWTGDGVVRAHRSGDPWSVWRWVDPADGTWSPYVYVNLEDPWRPTARGFDTRDWILDLVIHDDGAVTWKDEDELAWALEVGRVDAAGQRRIREAGDAALEASAAGTWPFATEWERWVSACTGPGLLLPPDWGDGPTRETD